jgi:hypothetical protein
VTKPSTFRQSDVSRAVRGAIKGGLPVGSFKVVVENGRVEVLPIAANESPDPGAAAARKIREAFGD